MATEDTDCLQVTFNPPLYLQRQTWLLNTLRHESVASVLDIGCGEGSLLQCLAEPSLTLPPTTSLPPTSPLVSGPSAEHHADLYLTAIHGLDPCLPDLEFAVLGTAPPDRPPFTGYDRWARREARWMPLAVSLWEGGFEALNDAFAGDKIDAFVASEVIEHLSPDLLPLFAPVLLGHYRPRLLLLTTPNFTYNRRFTRPGEISSQGYPDPTGRTDRVFRHHDHKFEWTTEEWTKYCTDAASNFGYTVDVGGVGLAVEPDPWNREPELGFASQVAVFRRLETKLPKGRSFTSRNENRHILRAKHLHLTHPLSMGELARPAVLDEVRGAAKAAMTDNREGTMTLSELWKRGEVSLKCAGDIGTLVRAFDPANIDHEEWEVEDDARGWEARVSWKNFVAIKEQSPCGAWPYVTDRIEDDWVCEDDWACEEDVGDDLFPREPAPPEDDDGVEEDSYSGDKESCSWGSASVAEGDPWSWDDPSAEPCGPLGSIIWTLPAVGEP